MPWGLKRYQQTRFLHFVTFSCYRRKPKLNTALARLTFEEAVERARVEYDFIVRGYVVMPEHVHLLLGEPERVPLARAIQSIKQGVSRKLALRSGEPFWQARYYDFNVRTAAKRIEKLRYMHRNPVKRGLVISADEWPWSSFRHYATGVQGIVRIESEWTQKEVNNPSLTS